MLIHILLLCLFLFTFFSSAEARMMSDLYQAEAIVTGTIEPERTRGFRIGLNDVLIKLTGNARLAEDVKLDPLLKRASDFVQHFEYEDRMKDIPIHDEQGTRERPHFLRMIFNQEKIDQQLATLGLKKWTEDRPVVLICFVVQTSDPNYGQQGSGYVISAEGNEGYGQRAVFMEAAKRRGIPVHFLKKDELSQISFLDVQKHDHERLRSAVPNADAVLSGVLKLKPTGYWDIEWHLSWQKETQKETIVWDEKELTFDQAIKNGLDYIAFRFSSRQ